MREWFLTTQIPNKGIVMGFWSSLFSGRTDSGDVVKVRESTSNNTHVRGDKLTVTDKSTGEHVHRSYDVDRSSGSYREYGGGEKSPDRWYNK